MASPKITDENSAPPLVKVSEHTFSRKKALVFGLVLGVGCGVVNTYLNPPELRWPYSPYLILWILGSIVSVIFLHEGIHGLAALMLGQRPVFGVKFPLVYTTFRHKLPRGALIVVALAPLFVLDVLGVILYTRDIAPFFFLLCVEINTIGAMGDCWIVMKLLGHERGTLVQDTMTGIEVWRRGE